MRMSKSSNRPSVTATQTRMRLAEEIAEPLHSMAIHLLRGVNRHDAASGLSPARLSLLSVLVFGGSRPLTTLARDEHVRAPTMSRLVAAMEAEGLVRRRSDVADGRIWMIEATDAGRAVMVAARDRRLRVLAALLARLPEHDLTNVVRATNVLADLLNADEGWHPVETVFRASR